jgi:hypothetical protein
MNLQARIQLTNAQLRAVLQRDNLQSIKWDDDKINSVLNQAFRNHAAELPPPLPPPRTNAAEMLPHTDQFMQGDRYGSIQARRRNGEVLVRMDKSDRLLWCKPEHIREYWR